MDPDNKHNESAAVEPDQPAAEAGHEATDTAHHARHKTVKISTQELEQLKAQAAENWDKFLRSTAEFDNYRKRVAREKEDLTRHTSERVMTALLPVLDNLDRALTAAETHTGEQGALLDGLKQIQSQFRRTLEQFGLQEVTVSAGGPFDPNLHEAISHVESSEHPEGAVLEQVQRGYKLADRLLRPARVVVSKGAAAEQDKPDA